MEIVKLMTVAAILFIGCTSDELSDAYGQFEADEILIAAETTGKLLSFEVEEGELLSENVKVAVVDTSALVLRKKELKASVKAIESKLANIEAQEEVINSQLATAKKNVARMTALKEENAATAQQLDEAEGAYETLKRQKEAIKVQRQSVLAEIETMNVRIDQVQDQMDKSVVINPVKGRVLATFVEPFEFTNAGKPLYEIANLDELILRVYVSGAQLDEVILGKEVTVVFDKDEKENHTTSGKVTWISSKAEFTPKMIQTKEERVTQVYAVKVAVKNPDGLIKIGMPGEVNFN
jgi:HlyD family secretion protein